MRPSPGDLRQQDRKGLLARIPAFPPIVLRLLDLLARDDVEIRELVALISSDPAFSAQILQVANSPLFGFRAQDRQPAIGAGGPGAAPGPLAVHDRGHGQSHEGRAAYRGTGALLAAHAGLRPAYRGTGALLLGLRRPRLYRRLAARCGPSGLVAGLSEGVRRTIAPRRTQCAGAAGLSNTRNWAWIIARPAAYWPSIGTCRRTSRSSPPAITIRKAMPKSICSPWCIWAAGWPIAWASGWSSRCVRARPRRSSSRCHRCLRSASGSTRPAGAKSWNAASGATGIPMAGGWRAYGRMPSLPPKSPSWPWPNWPSCTCPIPNAGESLSRELLVLVGIGLLFTVMIVALVYFALK